MNTNQKSMRYDQNDYDALLHSKIPAALVETPLMPAMPPCSSPASWITSSLSPTMWSTRSSPR